MIFSFSFPPLCCIRQEYRPPSVAVAMNCSDTSSNISNVLSRSRLLKSPSVTPLLVFTETRDVQWFSSTRIIIQVIFSASVIGSLEQGRVTDIPSCTMITSVQLLAKTPDYNYYNTIIINRHWVVSY